MTDQPDSQPTGMPAPASAGAGSADSDRLPASGGADHPEIAVGAAFAGGFVLAMILKRLAS